MSEDPFGNRLRRKAECPGCMAIRNVETLHEHKSEWALDEGLIHGYEGYYTLGCLGCETIFFAHATFHSEDYDEGEDPVTGEYYRNYNYKISYWPSNAKFQIPTWAESALRRQDEVLWNLLFGIYTCLNSDLPVFAAIGMRTAFDRVSKLLGVDPNLSFSDKIEELRKQGNISGVQKGTVEVLIDAGSAAAHRGWKPGQKHLATMLEILNALIREHLILRDEVEELKKKIPERDR